jgi:hypothetical protein
MAKYFYYIYGDIYILLTDKCIMAKFKLTENQLDRVKKTILTEQNDNTYSREILISFSSNSNQRYDGMTIDDVDSWTKKINVTYVIEQEHRSWGIKNISLYNIKGPESIDVEMTLYPEGSDEPVTKEVTIPLDWDNNLSISNEEGKGLITVGDVVNVIVYVGENNLITTELELDVYTL